jgi:NMD protein affecting ribosome stability and mRNA decay
VKPRCVSCGARRRGKSWQRHPLCGRCQRAASAVERALKPRITASDAVFTFTDLEGNVREYAAEDVKLTMNGIKATVRPTQPGTWTLAWGEK